MAKYKTKEEAINILKLDGKMISKVESYLKDDADIVELAIKNGGDLSHASARLKNDTKMILTEAEYGKQWLFDYNKALFCSKRDMQLCEKIAHGNMYKNNDEFQIELKIHYGNLYISPVEKYNCMSTEELRIELDKERKRQIKVARETYEEGEELRCWDGTSWVTKIKTNWSALQRQANYLRSEGKPFSDIIKYYETHIEFEKRDIDTYCTEKIKGSYPERIVNSLLTSLGIDFAQEYVFPWSVITNKQGKQISAKRYDFFIPDLSTIIEVHGSQHYDGSFESLGGRTLAEEQENDRQKERLAKENGIKHYIVINALNSNLDYIKTSIMLNSELAAMIDLSSINWNEIEAGTVKKVKKDISFPFFEETLSRNTEWINTIKSELTESDYIALTATKEEMLYSDSEEFIENMRNSIRSLRGLYPHEHLILKEAHYYRYPYKSSPGGTWFYTYGIGNIEIWFEKLFNDGFLTVGDVHSSVEHATVPDIKRVLSEHKLSTKGRKENLIAELFTNISVDELEKLFPQKYYELTELGKKELEENNYIMAKNWCGLSVWTLNRLAHAFPEENIDSILLKYCKAPKKFLRLLEKTERQKVGISSKNNKSGIPSKYQDRDGALNEAEILEKNNDLLGAVKKYIFVTFLDLIDPDYKDHKTSKNLKFYFPYSKSLIKPVNGIIKRIRRLMLASSIDNKEVSLIIDDILIKYGKYTNVFTAKECKSIIMSEIEEKYSEVDDVYKSAEARIQKEWKIF